MPGPRRLSDRKMTNPIDTANASMTRAETRALAGAGEFLAAGGRWAVAVGVVVTLLGSGEVLTAAASDCQVPAAFGIKVEQRQGVQAIFASSAQPPGAPLVAGDAIRQANGVRVERCVDLERVAVEALANGLVLLLGVERGGSLTAVAVTARPPVEQGRASPPHEAIESPPPTGRGASAPVMARGQVAPRVSAPSQIPAEPIPPVPTSTPRSSGTVELPPRAEASDVLRSCVAQAVHEFRTLDRMAQLSVPLVAYDRALHDATAAVASLHCGDDGPGASARAYIAETLDDYRSVSDIRHFSADFHSQREVDVRSGQALTMPYYADSEVTRWVDSYPFLRASLIESPRATRFLIPGEVPGRWSPDRAVDLLWEHARSRVARLAEWAATSG